MYKVLSIVGTRPELIKMSLVIKTISCYANHVLVHTGQNYNAELNTIFFEDLGIEEPRYYLDAASESSNPVQTISNILVSIDEVLRVEAPDAVLLYGDTNSCLSVLAAKRQKIPIFHMEAGNRCFDERVPEEINRKIVDHLSDINLTLTLRAREYLLAEGLRPDRVLHVGSHMDEVIHENLQKIRSSSVLDRLCLPSNSYFLASLHREENVDDPRVLEQILQTIDQVSSHFDKKCILSLHPRTKARLADFPNSIARFTRITCSEPFSFTDYVFLQMNCFCLLSDSGTVSEESRILGIPAITLRHAHERPEGIELGSFALGSFCASHLMEQIRLAVDTSRKSVLFDTDNLNLSAKVAKIVLGYVGFVNREVWNIPAKYSP